MEFRSRVLLHSAISVYVEFSLHEAALQLDDLKVKVALLSFNTISGVVGKKAVEAMEQLMLALRICKYELERGFHPYFTLSGLTAADRARDNAFRYYEVLFASTPEMQNALSVAAQDLWFRANFAVYSIVAERDGDNELAMAWTKASNKESQKSVQAKEKSTRPAFQFMHNITTAIKFSDEKDMLGREDDARGRSDLGNIRRKMARLTRMALAHHICSGRPGPQATNCYARAAEHTGIAADYLLAYYEENDAEAKDLLYQTHVHALSAADACLAAPRDEDGMMIEDSVTEMWEPGSERRMCDLHTLLKAVRAYRDAALEHITQPEVHPELHIAWTALTERYTEMVESIKAKLARAVRGEEKIETRDFFERERSSLYAADKYLQCLADRIEKAKLYRSAAAAAKVKATTLTAPVSAARTSDTSGSVTLLPTDIARSASEHWLLAAERMDEATEAGLASIRTDLFHPLDPAVLLSTCHTSIARHYANIAAAVLDTAAEYLRRATVNKRVLGANPHWASAAQCMVEVARRRRIHIEQTVADARHDDITNVGALHNSEIVLRSEAAADWELCAKAWADAAVLLDEYLRVKRRQQTENAPVPTQIRAAPSHFVTEVAVTAQNIKNAPEYWTDNFRARTFTKLGEKVVSKLREYLSPVEVLLGEGGSAAEQPEPNDQANMFAELLGLWVD